MRIKKIGPAVLAVAAVSANAAAPTPVTDRPNYLCRAESVAGLRAEENWGTVNYEPTQVVVVVKPLSPEQVKFYGNSKFGVYQKDENGARLNDTHGVFQVGLESPDHTCVYSQEHWLSCLGTLGSFQMDTRSGRFTKHSSGTYLYDSTLMDAYLAVGKCSAIQGS